MPDHVNRFAEAGSAVLVYILPGMSSVYSMSHREQNVFGSVEEVFLQGAV